MPSTPSTPSTPAARTAMRDLRHVLRLGLCLVPLLALPGCPATPLPLGDAGGDPAALDAAPSDAALETAPPDAALLDAALPDASGWGRAEWHAFVADAYGAICARWHRCTGQPDGCRPDRLNRGFDRTLRAMGEAIVRGEVDIDPAAAAACLDAVRDGEGCAPPWFDAPAGAMAFRGRLADGEACVVSDACGPASFCRLDAPCGGRCAPRVGLGEPCVSHSDCQDGAYCDLGICRAHPAPGGACVDFTDCGPYEGCADGACRPLLIDPPVGLGEPCRDGRRPLPIGLPRDGAFWPAWAGCEAGLACALTPDGARCVAAGDVGQACGADDDPPCATALACDGSTARCAPRLEPGAPCGAGERICPAETPCVDGRCLPPSPAGIDCDVDGHCAGGACIDGVCAPDDTRCGRAWSPPPECMSDANCPPMPAADAICSLNGYCAYLARGQRWRLTDPESAQLPALTALVGGWPGDVGWLLQLDGDDLWLAPALGESRPHPRLPATPLFGTVEFYDAPIGVLGRYVSGRAQLMRPTEDPCIWAPVPVEFSLELAWDPWPDAVRELTLTLKVQHGLDIRVGDQPLDDLMRANDLPSDAAGEHWYIPIRWQASPAQAGALPVFGMPAMADVCGVEP